MLSVERLSVGELKRMKTLSTTKQLWGFEEEEEEEEQQQSSRGGGGRERDQGMSQPSAAPSVEAQGEGNRGYAVELYFDPALENQVLKAWNALARRHISTRLIDLVSRPHLALFHSSSSSPPLDPSKLLPALRSFAARQDPLPLSLSAVAAFPSPINTLFLSPTPFSALLNLHSQLYDVLRKEGVEVAEEYRPGSWVPHCAAALDVPRARTAEAFAVLRDLRLPVSGYAMDLGLVEFTPVVREVFSFNLGGGGLDP